MHDRIGCAWYKGILRLEIGGWCIERIGATYQSAVQNVDLAFVMDPIATFIPGIQESIDKKLTAYTVINARIGYEFTDSWKTNLIVSNLTNTEYAIRPADLGAPRSVRLQVTYTLDKSN